MILCVMMLFSATLAVDVAARDASPTRTLSGLKPHGMSLSSAVVDTPRGM